MALRPSSTDWQAILEDNTEYAGLFETGTHKGDFAILAKKQFQEVITVENNEYYYNLAREDKTGIKYYYGDSVEKLNLILPLEGRWVFYLDAHYFIDPDKRLTKSRFPLFKELDLITSRQPEWLIIVDDVHNFGVNRKDLKIDPGVQEWEAVTVQNLAKYGRPVIYKDVCLIYQEK